MAASSKLMIIEAERRFPVRIRRAIPAGGLGDRLNHMQGWLDENCGAEGWVMIPSGLRGVVNDAVAIYSRPDDRERLRRAVVRWVRGGECRRHVPRSG